MRAKQGTQDKADASPSVEQRLSFAQRLANVPEAGRGPWILAQLSKHRFVPGALSPAWPHFESQCELHLKFKPPADRAYPKRRERRPGNRYAPTINQISKNELRWSSQEDRPPTFALERSVAAGQRERFFRQGHRLWTQLPPEPWSERPVDDDFHLRWVQEHRDCVGELLALAGPALVLHPQASPAPGQLAFTVSLREAPAPVVARDTALARRAWRAYARVLSLSGQLSVDESSGAWLSADLQLRLSVSPPKQTAFEGSASLRAKTRVLSAGQMSWPTPEPALALPQPPRYHHEQKTLLEGLAPGGAAGLGTLR